jgi:glycosyltransferase involved in cell wall biosynthesis
MMPKLLREGVPQGERPEGALPARSRPPARRPHVCFVAPQAWPVLSGDPRIAVVGGAEVQQSILARLFARSGYRVSMIAHDYGQPERTVTGGVTVYRAHAPDAGVPVLRFLHPRLTSIWRAMREADADIYYQRSASMLCGVVAAFCRRHRRRSLYAGASDRDFLPDHGQIRYLRDRWLYRHGLRTVDAIVVQNAVQQETCRRYLRREPVLIPSCYEPPAHARRGGGDCVLWVGTVHAQKRPEMLLELAARLPHRRFAMVGGPGSGELRRAGYFEAIAQRAATLPNLAFTGFLPLAEVEPWFDRARVHVNTSFSEGMPNTFLQAWARGVPVVASVDVGARTGGGPLYPVFDRVDEAAAEIERMFEDQAHWSAASARALQYFAATHGPDEVLARYARVFDALVASA